MPPPYWIPTAEIYPDKITNRAGYSGAAFQKVIKMEIMPGRYRHFKGKEYLVLGIARHSETLEPMVVYRALYGNCELWVRPAAMWTETVNTNGYNGPRFQYLEDNT